MKQLSVFSPGERTGSSGSSDLQISNEMLSEARTALEPFLKGKEVELRDRSLGNADIWALGNLLAETKHSHVTSLDISNNAFTDSGLNKLVMKLEGKDNLINFDLSENSLGRQACLDLSLCISQTPVQNLILSETFATMDDKDGIRFLAEMIEASQLVKLNLTGCKVGLNLEVFCNAVNTCSSLKSLILENTFEKEELKYFVDSLCSNKSDCRLHELNLNYCAVPEAKILGPLFAHGNFKNLRKLSLDFAAHRRGKTEQKNRKLTFWTVLRDHMKLNRSIIELSLRMNFITCQDSGVIREILALPSALQVVDLFGNNIGSIGLKQILMGVEKNKKLRELCVDENPCLDSSTGQERYKQILEVLAKNQREQSKISQFTQNTLHHVRGTEIVRSKLKRGSGDAMMSNFFLEAPEKSVGTNSKPKKGRRKFAAKLRKIKEKPQIRRVPSPNSANDNLDNDDSTFVFIPDQVVKPKKGKRKFAKKLIKGSAPKNQTTRKEEIQCGSHNDNLNEEYSSVVFNASETSPISKTRKKKFAAKKQMLNFGHQRNIQDAGSHNNNLDGEEDTCVFQSSLEDEASSIIFEQDINDDDINSVIYEEEESPQLLEMMKARDPRRVFSPSGCLKTESRLDLIEDDETLSGKITEPDKGTWALTKISKSELGFIRSMRMMMQSTSVDNEQAGILDLHKKDLTELSKMLGEWENLLDRDEYIRPNARSMRFGSMTNTKRPFARKMGVIGKLSAQKTGQVVNYPLAKSAIGQTLISRALVRNIYLLSLFAKLQREIGSGVPTKVGGMLPSVLLDTIVHEKEKVPTVEKVESFASAFLLIKVVIWSVLKALCISKPDVDPNGRHLLEEFGKAMFDKEDNKLGKQNYEEDSPEEICRKQSQMGKTILTGAAFELMDALILLKPMVAVADAIFAAGTTDYPQLRLSTYDQLQNKKEKKAIRKISKKMQKVDDMKRFSVLKKFLRDKQDRRPKSSDDRMSIKSKNTKGNANGLQDLLSGVEGFKKKKEISEQSNRQSLKKKRGSAKIPISPRIQMYRHNCKERLRTVLQDIKAESRSLNVILNVEGFLPMLFSLVEIDDLKAHYERRKELLIGKMDGWFDGLAEELESQFITQMKPTVLPTISAFLHPKTGKATAASPPENELFKKFRSLRNKKDANPLSTRKNLVSFETAESLKLEKQSYFNPMLNQIFAPVAMSPMSAHQVRKVLHAKVNDSRREERNDIIHHLQKLCRDGPEDTDFVHLAKITESFNKDHQVP